MVSRRISTRLANSPRKDYNEDRMVGLVSRTTPTKKGIKRSYVSSTAPKVSKHEEPVANRTKNSPETPQKKLKKENTNSYEEEKTRAKIRKEGTSSPCKPPCVATAKKADWLRAEAAGVIDRFRERRMAMEAGTDDRYKWLVGAHVSMAGGVQNAIINAVMLGAMALAMDLKSKRRWEGPPLKTEDIAMFKEACAEFGFRRDRDIVPHGSYLINLGSPDETMWEKSVAAVIDELHRCDQLGITLWNFHPGTNTGNMQTDEECLDRIAEGINRALADPKSGQNTVVVVENMAGQGSTMGNELWHLRHIIERVEDKSRIGICLDTCHAFAAGVDVKTGSGFSAYLDEVDEQIGLSYLRAMHLNDSKGPQGCRKDRHENLGKGEIGLDCFRFIMNEPRLQGIPLVLETPNDKVPTDVWNSCWRCEVDQLYNDLHGDNSK
eukprot:Clim_evm21s201 gene=Clim_evmTU21s201